VYFCCGVNVPWLERNYGQSNAVECCLRLTVKEPALVLMQEKVADGMLLCCKASLKRTTGYKSRCRNGRLIFLARGVPEISLHAMLKIRSWKSVFRFGRRASSTLYLDHSCKLHIERLPVRLSLVVRCLEGSLIGKSEAITVIRNEMPRPKTITNPHPALSLGHVSGLVTHLTFDIGG
jgi:hypothetical protein